MLEHFYNFPSNRVMYLVDEILPIWQPLYFRPTIALMILHGDLQLTAGELAIAYFGNLPAYCLELVVEFYNQLYREEPRAAYYHPRDVKQPILPSVNDMELRQLVWNNMTDKQFYEYRSHWSIISSTTMTIYNTMIDNDKFIRRFKNKTVT